MQFEHAYRGDSRIVDSGTDTALSFSPDLTRPPTFFKGELRAKLPFREAMSALHDVVVSDLRQKPKDRSAYLAWRAQQDAIAGHDPHVAHEHVGDAVGRGEEVGVRPARAAGGVDAGRVAAAFGHAPVEELGRAIELRGERELRQVEKVFGLLFARRQVVARERVDMRCTHHDPPDRSASCLTSRTRSSPRCL